jgi:hypothetical protein
VLVDAARGRLAVGGQDGRAHGLDRAEAGGRVLGHGPGHDRGDLVGQGDPARARVGHRRGDVLHREGEAALAVEGPRAGQCLEQHHPERVLVGRRADPLALGLLGGQVVGRAEDRAGPGQVRGRLHGQGDAEVGHLGLAVPGDQDVGRLDVAVDHAAGVGVGERGGHLGADRHGRRPRQAPLAVQRGGQVLAVDQLHDHVGAATVGAVVEDAGDVRVQQGGRVAGLAPEALDELGVLGQLLGQDLDRHDAPEHLVVGPVHGAHAAPGQPLAEQVAAAQQSLRHVASSRTVGTSTLGRVVDLPVRPRKSGAAAVPPIGAAAVPLI